MRERDCGGLAMSIGVGGRSRLLTYSCPRCGASLEVAAEAVPGWYRCPGCGRASQPPEPVLSRKRAPENEVLVIGERGVVTSFSIEPDDPPYPRTGTSADPFREIERALDPSSPVNPPRPIFRPAMPTPPPPSAGVPALRIVLGVLFFLATVLFVFSALAQDGISAAVFGLGAVVLLMLLARPSRRRL